MHVRADIVRVVQTDIRRVRQRPVVTVNIVRHRELVINAVLIPISIVVAVRDIHPEVVRRAEENIRAVLVQQITHGMVAVAYLDVVLECYIIVMVVVVLLMIVLKFFLV